jgi:tetratricopeptide (TPR) repeat protein
MTPSQTPSNVRVPTAVLAAAADALVRAGRHSVAIDLLDAATVGDDHARALVALAAARATLDSDYRSGTKLAPSRISVADAAVRAVDDPKPRWDLELLEVRRTYFDALFARGGAKPQMGPWGRDPRDVDELRAAAKRLYDSAPDDGRRGWAAMFQGYIADNVAGERDAAPAHYREALESAESTGDDYLVFEALRHLGDHDHDDGDHEQARQRWERSAEHAARAGSVPGTLAQLLLVAVLDRDTNDEAGAQALAREIARWAGEIGATRLQAQARAFVGGVDPTAPPPEAAQD